MINKIKQLIVDGLTKINIASELKEKEKAGQLRAGSAGAIVGDKVYTAKCIRIDQARQLGFQKEITQDEKVMFAGGIALEQYIEEHLIATGVEFKKEETITIDFMYEGTKLSGRPDFEIKIDGEWVGLEVKSLASPFSVVKQVKNKFPLMKHMLQAATYCMLTKRNKWIIVVGNVFHAFEKGTRYPPSLRWYTLNALEDGSFNIVNESEEVITLPFNKNQIFNYYVKILQGNEDKQLGGRPHEEELNIDTYNRCKYCPQESACNKYDNNQIGFDEWMENIKTKKETK